MSESSEREWKRGVPEVSGWYWYRQDNGITEVCKIEVRRLDEDTVSVLAELVGTDYMMESLGDPQWFSTTEFCPLREKAPE